LGAGTGSRVHSPPKTELLGDDLDRLAVPQHPGRRRVLEPARIDQPGPLAQPPPQVIDCRLRQRLAPQVHEDVLSQSSEAYSQCGVIRIHPDSADRGELEAAVLVRVPSPVHARAVRGTAPASVSCPTRSSQLAAVRAQRDGFLRAQRGVVEAADECRQIRPDRGDLRPAVQLPRLDGGDGAEFPVFGSRREPLARCPLLGVTDGNRDV
jgi:hypothetical protein